MPTIAKTNRYKELNYRHLKLVQLYSVFSELRLHTNKAVNIDTAKYYHNQLYKWGDYGAFLTASLESMMQVFYIELDGFIGAYWDPKSKQVQKRKNDEGSLAVYLYDGTRTTRKKSAIKRFELLLEQKADDLDRIHKVRHKLAHFEKLNKRNKALVPGGTEIREILDMLAEVLYLLGFQKWNKPHLIKQDDSSTDSTQKVIFQLVGGDPQADDMRKTYIESRKRWFKE